MKTLKLICLIIFVFTIFCSLDKDQSQQKNIHPALQMLPIPQGLGVNIHFYKGNENDWKMLEQVGIGIVRMDVSWAGVEKKLGEYDFSHYDLLIRDLEQRNIRLLFIIDYGNPLYDEGLAPYTEKSRKANTQFCAALAKRYANKNIIWELWNEPNLDHFWKPKKNVNDYMKWCKAVVPAIRQNDADACIIAPATSSVDIPFMESCFKQGLLQIVDGVSVHPYRSVQLGPETAIDDYHVLSALIAQYKPRGKVIPIISGEWGYSTTHLSPKLQGKYLARQWLSNMAEKIPISIWYDWHDDGTDAENAEHNFGSVTWDYKAKPAYIAMKNLVRQFNEYTPIGRIGIGGIDDYVVLFHYADQVKLAVWTTGEPHEIELDKNLNVEGVVNYLGQLTKLRQFPKILISDEPLYIELSAPLPNWLNMILKANKLNYEEAETIALSLIEDPSKNSFSNELMNSMDNGQLAERISSFFILTQIADKFSDDSFLKQEMNHLVLKRDRNVLNTRTALNGLSEIASLKSMEFVAPLFKNSLFTQEIANYYLQVAFKLAGKKDVRKAKELLVKAAGYSQHRYAVERVVRKIEEMGMKLDKAALNRISEKAGFINHWWVAGPFPNENDIAEHQSFFPEQNINFSQTQTFDTLKAKWQETKQVGIYPIISYAKFFGKKQLAAYAYTELNSPVERPAKFKIGSNDGVICWLNGKKVHENLVGRKLTVDEDEVDVNLKQGLNKLLLKVPNKGANWEVCLRVCDTNGVPLDINQYLK